MSKLESKEAKFTNQVLRATTAADCVPYSLRSLQPWVNSCFRHTGQILVACIDCNTSKNCNTTKSFIQLNEKLLPKQGCVVGVGFFTRLRKSNSTIFILTCAWWNGTIPLKTFIETENSCCVTRFPSIAGCYKIVDSWTSFTLC